MTFRQTLTKSLLKGMFIFALCAIYMVTVWFTPTGERGTDDDIMGTRDHAVGSPAYVIEKAKCVQHTGSDFPTGVVYQTSDSVTHFSKNPTVVGKALDSVLGGKAWNGHTVNMFCK